MTVALNNIEMQKEPMMSTYDSSFTLEESRLNAVSKYIKIKNHTVREFIAELFGTFLLVVFINGCIAQNVFYAKDDENMNSLLSVNITCGFGVTIAILAVGKISGAHINPAVSFSMLLQRKLSALKFIVFVIAQLIGGFLGALAVYITYYDILYNFEDELTLNTAGIFATYPHKNLSFLGGLFDQTFGTTLLIIIVLAATDKKNELSHASIAGFLGVAVMIIGTSFCYNCGYAINPARDFGPRLFTYLAGWGNQVFTAGNYFFIVPIVGPMLGGVFGTFIYFILISNHWPDEK